MLVYLRDGSALTSARAATQIEVADQTFYLTQSQYTDARPTSPSAGPYNTRRLARQTLECQFLSHWYDSIRKKIPTAQAGFELRIFNSRGRRLNHQANEAVGGHGTEADHAGHLLIMHVGY